MNRKILWLLTITVLGPHSLVAQDAGGFKNFKRFTEVVPGIDFFASTRDAVTPFEQPLADARARLETVLASTAPKGAIFVCSTLEQKDSVYEPRALKMGYTWTLTALTPEAQADEIIQRMKAQLGDQIPADRLERIRSGATQMREAAVSMMVRNTSRNMALAMLQVMLAPAQEYRSSRLDDVSRSPLPDWLDVGIASYVSGGPAVRFLQQHLEEAFPLEDVMTMSRPFVAPSAAGGPFVIRMGQGSGGGQGGAPPSGGPGNVVVPAPGAAGAGPGAGSGGMRMGGGEMPKDQKDRLLFDGQSGTFFSFLLEKLGMDKVKQVVQQGREGKDPTDFITGTDALAADMTKVEEEWGVWVKAQKPEPEMRMRFGGGPGQSNAPRQ